MWCTLENILREIQVVKGLVWWIRGYVKISILKFIEIAKVKGGKFRFGSRKNEEGRKERK